MPTRAKHRPCKRNELNVSVARMIHDARLRAGLTQAELGERISTRQQAIARLEDPNYDGHSLRVLKRIADALSLRLTVSMQADSFASGQPGDNP